MSNVVRHILVQLPLQLLVELAPWKFANFSQLFANFSAFHFEFKKKKKRNKETLSLLNNHDWNKDTAQVAKLFAEFRKESICLFFRHVMKTFTSITFWWTVSREVWRYLFIYLGNMWGDMEPPTLSH